MDSVNRGGNDSIMRNSLCDRIQLSWQTRLSAQVRYEIASAIACFGLFLSLLGSGFVYLACASNSMSESFIHTCLSLGLVPISVALVSLALGVVILFSGIYLLPQRKIT